MISDLHDFWLFISDYFCKCVLYGYGRSSLWQKLSCSEFCNLFVLTNCAFCLVLTYDDAFVIFRRRFRLICWWICPGGWAGDSRTVECAGVRHCKQFALTFRFPLIMLSLVNRFTSYSHKLLLRSTTFHKHALWHWPSDDLDIQDSFALNFGFL